MKNNDSYVPINCEIHDGYELACMHQSQHQIQWYDEEGQQQSQRLLCRDLICQQGEEFLIAEDHNGKTLRIRLDKIISSLPY